MTDVMNISAPRVVAGENLARIDNSH